MCQAVPMLTSFISEGALSTFLYVPATNLIIFCLEHTQIKQDIKSYRIIRFETGLEIIRLNSFDETSPPPI